MNRALQIARMVLLLSAAGLCASGGWFLWNLNQAAASLKTDAAKFAAVADQASATLEAINRPCNAKDSSGRALSNGTLCDIGETMKLVKLNGARFTVLANKEISRVDLLNAQEAQLASDTHRVLDNASDGILSAKRTLAGLDPVERQTTQEIAELEKTTESLNALVSDPNLHQMAANLNAASANASSTLAHASATTADVQQAVHSYLHPTLPQKIWHGITNTGIEVAKFFW